MFKLQKRHALNFRGNFFPLQVNLVSEKVAGRCCAQNGDHFRTEVRFHFLEEENKSIHFWPVRSSIGKLVCPQLEWKFQLNLHFWIHYVSWQDVSHRDQTCLLFFIFVLLLGLIFGHFLNFKSFNLKNLHSDWVQNGQRKAIFVRTIKLIIGHVRTSGKNSYQYCEKRRSSLKLWSSYDVWLMNFEKNMKN